MEPRKEQTSGCRSHRRRRKATRWTPPARGVTGPCAVEDPEHVRKHAPRTQRRVRDLSARVQRGAYRAKAVRRVFIAKGDERQRPLGVTALEDKIVQRSVVGGHLRYYGCLRTRRRWPCSVIGSRGCGTARCGAAVGRPDSPGSACGGLSSAGSIRPTCVIPIPYGDLASYPTPEPGAVVPHAGIWGGGDQQCSFLLRL